MLMRRTTRNVPDLINIFDDFFGGDFFTSPVLSGYRSIPAVNVRETDDEYAIEVAALDSQKMTSKLSITTEY